MGTRLWGFFVAMTSSRLNAIVAPALAAKKRLDQKGFVKRNSLPLVSFAEHKELSTDHPSLSRYTRCFDYEENEYIEDVNRAGPARLPIVREIWVGARSLACIGEEETPDGIAKSQIEQEDSAELTELQTLLYDHAQSGRPMIEDPESGELRPIRNGDVICIVRGSNDDLDALFMDEAADPRSEDDAIIRSLIRDRINPNSDHEQQMLNEPDMAIPSQDDDLAENDIYLMRVANHLASSLVEKRPELQKDFLELRKLAFEKVKSAHCALKTGEGGKILAGSFKRPKDIWDEQEQYIRKLENHINRKQRRSPGPMDWDQIGHRDSVGLHKPASRPTLKPGQKWLRVTTRKDGRIHSVDISGLAKQLA